MSTKSSTGRHHDRGESAHVQRARLRWGDDPLGAIARLPSAVPQRHDLVVVSNRTPTLRQGRTREVGGLVSALAPALRDQSAVWLGWSGEVEHASSDLAIDTASEPTCARFDLPADVRDRFYAGFCNSALWPLFHGFPDRVRVSHEDWDAYVAANERYARHATALARGDATIWIHDYHLLLAARALRAHGHRGRIGLFLHIPFPAREELDTLSWSGELVSAMLDFDLIGFQTERFAENFLAAASAVPGAVRTGTSIHHGAGETEVGVFPATIDPEPFRAETEEVDEIGHLRQILGQRRLILGVDRLDYSKGIPERLAAYERMLEQYPEWRRRVAFVQISVPSRADIPDYAELRDQVEHLVGHINGRFGDIDWVPVRYLYRSYDHRVLAQLYRLADVALVTPLCDGMNLVAKEFVVSQTATRPGVLVLSRHAGAAEGLADAVITDPLQLDVLAADIARALDMPDEERVKRHTLLTAALEREGDARLWAQRFLDQLAPPRLRSVG